MDADGFTVVRRGARNTRGRNSANGKGADHAAGKIRYVSNGAGVGTEESHVTADEVHARLCCFAAVAETSAFFHACKPLFEPYRHVDPHPSAFSWHRTSPRPDSSTSPAHNSTAREVTRAFAFAANDEESETQVGQEEGLERAPVPVSDVVCYGVGQVKDNTNAAAQLALAVVLAEWLRIPGKVHLYEPVLGASEIDGAAMLGCSLIQENEECKRRVSEPTVFFMPHCGARLYNNVLWANWGPDTLRNVVLVGNSFFAYALRHATARLEQSVPYLYKMLDYVDEQPLPSNCPAAFHDTVIMRFDRICAAPTTLWEDCAEPPPLASGEEI